jgi:hypothetical protein
VRDTQALNKYLIMTRSRTNDLLAQADKLLRMDLNTNAQRFAFTGELLQAECFCSSVKDFLQKSVDEFIKSGGAR